RSTAVPDLGGCFRRQPVQGTEQALVARIEHVSPGDGRAVDQFREQRAQRAAEPSEIHGRSCARNRWWGTAGEELPPYGASVKRNRGRWRQPGVAPSPPSPAKSRCSPHLVQGGTAMKKTLRLAGLALGCMGVAVIVGPQTAAAQVESQQVFQLVQ